MNTNNFKIIMIIIFKMCYFSHRLCSKRYYIIITYCNLLLIVIYYLLFNYIIINQ